MAQPNSSLPSHGPLDAAPSLKLSDNVEISIEIMDGDTVISQHSTYISPSKVTVYSEVNDNLTRERPYLKRVK